jgi:hypothetical protein
MKLSLGERIKLVEAVSADHARRRLAEADKILRRDSEFKKDVSFAVALAGAALVLGAILYVYSVLSGGF